MAERNRDSDEPDGASFNRRSYLKIAGATAAIAATGLTSSAVAEPSSYDPDTVVDLGEKGLSDGDVIDPYLDEYFENDTEVRIPEGEYDWRGSNFGDATRNAGLVGEGEVILNAVRSTHNNNIRAGGGALVYRNMTVRGQVSDSRLRWETDSSGHILVENLNLPDGSDTDDNSQGFYVPRDHAGEIEFRNCYIRSFSDNGIYANSPGYDGAAGGRVVVDGCVTVNNNISGIRVGSDNSVVRNCLVINDDRSPSAPTGRNQRGIWVRSGGDDVLIENCDVIHSYSGAGAPIIHGRDGRDGTGHIENVRIHNDTSNRASNAPSAWSGNDIDVTGDGDLRVPSHFTNVCQGSGCDQPNDNHQVDDREGRDGADDSSGDDGADGDSHTIEFVMNSTDSGGIDYEFTTTGEIRPMRNRERYPANEDSAWAEENDDGTWTAWGFTSGGESHSGDSFEYEGDMTEWNVSGDPDGTTYYANGEEVDPQEDLVVEQEEENTNDGTGDDGTGGDTGDDNTGDGDSSGDGSEEEDLSHRIIIDGTTTETVSIYRVNVTGQIEFDQSSSSTVDGGTAWDEMEGEYDEGSVTGVVGKGIDGYRYSGTLTELNVEGTVDITIENNL